MHISMFSNVFNQEISAPTKQNKQTDKQTDKYRQKHNLLLAEVIKQ